MGERRTWGLLCPEGHGLLVQRESWTAKGVAWCPHEMHGGNGRFYRTQEANEGWYDTNKLSPIDRSRAEELEAIAAARTEAWEKNRRIRVEAEIKPPKVKAPKAIKDPTPCTCGCGGLTKGGRFLPGHDARFHARVKALEAQGLEHEEAAKIASKGPLTGKYATAASTKSAKAPKDPNAPEPIKTASARVRKPKPVDLTSRATDEPADEQPVPPVMDEAFTV